MHVSEMFVMTRSNPRVNLFRDMSGQSATAARELIIAAVLGTDMACHFQKLATFNSTVVAEAEARLARTSDHATSPLANLKLQDKDRKLALAMCLHVADVNNPMRPLRVYKAWAYRVMDEFFLQGDQEVSFGIDISPFMDRHNAQPVQCQNGFIKFIVEPLFTSWGNLVPDLKSDFKANLAENRVWLARDDCFADLDLDPVMGRYQLENEGGAEARAAFAAPMVSISPTSQSGGVAAAAALVKSAPGDSPSHMENKNSVSASSVESSGRLPGSAPLASP